MKEIMELRITSIAISIAALLGFAWFWLYTDQFPGIVGIVLFTSPALISLFLTAICRRPDSLKTLAVLSKLHGVCIVFLVLLGFTEPQSALWFIGCAIFFGLYMLVVFPVLMVMLITVAVREIPRLFNKKDVPE